MADSVPGRSLLDPAGAVVNLAKHVEPAASGRVSPAAAQLAGEVVSVLAYVWAWRRVFPRKR